MTEKLVEELEVQASQKAEEICKEWREQTLFNIRNSWQGAGGLEEYVTDVHEPLYEDDSGAYQFQILHPTAALHEHGGHIEPTYANAKRLGWSRDEFYEALTDCNEFVDRKKHVTNARAKVRMNDSI